MTWYVEHGIGEERAIRLAGGDIAEARIHWPGTLSVGHVEDARLVSRLRGSKRGTVQFEGGEQALVDRLPPEASEGSTIRCRVTRPAWQERDRAKLAHALPSDDRPCSAPGLAEQLEQEGHRVESVSRFPEGDWNELWLEAWDGRVAFDGGELAFFETSAMTLIDIDGPGSPRELALASVPALGDALRRFDMGGSIGIDFPTLEARADRKTIDAALALTLGNWPHEKTAMNGFGFVQIVARLQRPSLLQRINSDRAGAAARLLLRRAEHVADPGALSLTMHPAVKAKMSEDWRAEIERKTGREIRLETDPGLALEAGFTQAVAR